MKPTTEEPNKFKSGKKFRVRRGKRPNDNEGDEPKKKRFRGKPYKKKIKHLEFLRNKEKQDLFPGSAPVAPSKLKKYKKGQAFDINSIQTIKEKHRIRNQADLEKEATLNTARNELLQTEEAGYLIADEGEETFRFTQKEIRNNVDIATASKNFNLNLFQFGPYRVNYSRDGRYLLLAGRKGHIVLLDWYTKDLIKEFNVMETVTDIQFFNMPTMFAVAQKEWVRVYDKDGTEINTLKNLHRIMQLEYLPYHYLLVSTSEKGILTWMDTSLGGKVVNQIFSKAGPIPILKQNPYNATVLTGHSNGTVSIWSPNSDKPLIKMLCHPSQPIRGLSITHDGNYLATAGNDRSLKIWDMRTHKELNRYVLRDTPRDLDYSQTGLLGVGLTSVVEVYKDIGRSNHITPYLRHSLNHYQGVENIRFTPFEDCMGIGNAQGFANILVPGSGEANYDALEVNPFMTVKQRREAEIKAALEKIPSELITLDPTDIAKVHIKSLREKWEERKNILHIRPKDFTGIKMVPATTTHQQSQPPKFPPKPKKKSLI